MYEYTLNIDMISKRPYMVEEREVDYLSTRKMRSPDMIVDMMNNVYGMSDLAEEHVYMLTMNAKCDVTGMFLIGQGSESTCMCSIRSIMQRALLAGASQMVIVHNHPSGDPTPSDLDFVIAKRIATVGAMLEVELLDSIIIGDHRYISTKAENAEAIKPMEVPNDWIK